MTCSREEPIPIDYHLPGDIVYTPGFSEAYEIISYPVCRLYIDESPEAKFKFQPHSFEYRPGTKGNYLSYLAKSLSFKNAPAVYVTDQFLKKYRKSK